MTAMLRILLGILTFLIVGPALSQSQSETERRVARILMNAATEMSEAINNALEKRYSNRRDVVLRKVSIRLIECGRVYNEVANRLEKSNKEKSLKELAVRNYGIYSIAFPLTVKRLNHDSAMLELLKTGKKSAMTKLDTLMNNEQTLYYFLRNCRDFTEPGQAVNGIRELFFEGIKTR